MNKPKTRSENIVVQEMDQEILIYDLKTNKAFCLNETSAVIWNLCDGKHSIEQISRNLSRNLNQPITEDLVWLAIDSFKKDNLLENNEVEIDFNGLSRRQVIRKIGLTSLAALPVVASVVAPASAATASLSPNLAGCSTSSQCQSNNCAPNALGGRTCCAAGSGSPSAVSPGSGTCTPAGTCATSYNATRCCTQSGAAPGAFFCPAPFESCVCL